MVQRQLSRYRQTHSSLSRTLLRFRNRLRDDREEILRRESILSQLLQERSTLREELGTARSKLDRAHLVDDWMQRVQHIELSTVDFLTRCKRICLSAARQ